MGYLPHTISFQRVHTCCQCIYSLEKLVRTPKYATNHFIAFIIALISSSWCFAQSTIPTIPQIPAFLPLAHSVAPLEKAMPLDGVWNITSINKRIRIDRGRVYAVDSWLHLFVLKIQPNMVVMKDVRQTGAGAYTSNDLPLMGTAVMKANANGDLDVSVASVLGPVNYTLAQVDLDDRDWFNRDRNGESSDDDREEEEEEEDQDEGEDEDEDDYDSDDEDDYEDDYP